MPLDDERRDDLSFRVRGAKTDEEFLAACVRLLQFDAERQKVWNGATAREAYLKLTDVIAEYYEKKSPRHPWKS